MLRRREIGPTLARSAHGKPRLIRLNPEIAVQPDRADESREPTALAAGGVLKMRGSRLFCGLDSPARWRVVFSEA